MWLYISLPFSFNWWAVLLYCRQVFCCVVVVVVVVVVLLRNLLPRSIGRKSALDWNSHLDVSFRYLTIRISFFISIFLYDVRHVLLNLFRGQNFWRIGTPRTVSVVHASLISIQERQIRNSNEKARRLLQWVHDTTVDSVVCCFIA